MITSQDGTMFIDVVGHKLKLNDNDILCDGEIMAHYSSYKTTEKVFKEMVQHIKAREDWDLPYDNFKFMAGDVVMCLHDVWWKNEKDGVPHYIEGRVIKDEQDDYPFVFACAELCSHVSYESIHKDNVTLKKRTSRLFNKNDISEIQNKNRQVFVSYLGNAYAVVSSTNIRFNICLYTDWDGTDYYTLSFKFNKLNYKDFRIIKM